LLKVCDDPAGVSWANRGAKQAAGKNTKWNKKLPGPRLRRSETLRTVGK
jgi:hypothetical protein